MRRLLLAFTLPLLGCARDFVFAEPKSVLSPWLDTGAVWLSTGPETEVQVGLAVIGRRGVRLRNALLGIDREPPCSSDRTFVSLELDGRPVTQGPVELTGKHALAIAFRDDREFARLKAGGSVDLSLEFGHGHGHGCVRIPLYAVPEAPRWQPIDEPRFAMGAELESSFLRYRDPANVAPVAGGGFWFGVETGDNRLFLLQSAAYTSNPTSKASGHLALTLGGAHRLLHAGPFSASMAGGYQLDWYFARDGQSEHSTRHFLHGPVVTPSLAYSLVSSRDLPTARGGSLSLELGAPTLFWFAAPGAGGATVVGGFTVGCFGVF